MVQLSIFMPSNRDLKGSYTAIETALKFCEARGCKLVVADNSGDSEKRSRWENASSCLIYLPTSGLGAKDNFLAALHACDTPFVLPMGDDDEIYQDAQFPSVDLRSLPEDHIGVLLHIDVWSTSRGVLKTKTFAIKGDDPAARMLEYNEHSDGDNAAYYSIFRRDVYARLMQHFFAHHPNTGSFSDWSMLVTLVAWGKMAYDPSILFRYNYDQWQSTSLIAARSDYLYTSAGLPADARKFHYLLLFLDLFCYAACDFSPLTKAEAAQSMEMAAGPFLDAFLKRVASTPHLFDAEIHSLCYKVAEARFMFSRFLIALDMVECVKPGYRDKYIRFFNLGMGDIE